MEFSNIENLSGICQKVDDLLGTDSTEYPLTKKARDANSALDDATILILRSDANWEWDDLNRSDLPIGTMDLVLNQQDYSPSNVEFLKVSRIEIKDPSGNWIHLSQLDQTHKRGIALAEYRKTAGTPREFDLFGSSIFLYPKPSYSSVGGLKIYYQRVPDYFTQDDTTKEPGIAASCHLLIPYKMALEYAVSKSMAGKVDVFQARIADLEAKLIEHYSSRNKDYKIRMKLAREDYGVSDCEGEESVNWGN